MSLQSDVRYFLSQVRDVMTKEGGKYFYNPGDREKNRKDLADLEITPTQVRETIHNLSYENYYKGPDKDFEIEGSITYEFGTHFDNYEIYIKLMLIEKYGLIICKCISFHIAERPISYPLKGGDEE